MKWQCSRELISPLPGLPRRTIPYPSELETRLTLTSDITSQEDDAVIQWLRTLSDDNTLAIKVDRLRWFPEQLPPPWHDLRWKVDNVCVEQVLKAHILFELRLLSADDLGHQPYLPETLLNQFAQQPDQNNRLREALFFAFFDKQALFSGKGGMDHWLKAIRDVVYERGQLVNKRKTGSTLISLGFELLEQVHELRESSRTLNDIETQWQNFEATHGHTLPVACAIVFWDAAVYTLSEYGEMDSARQCLAKQSQALRALVELLPGLRESDLMAGMWCHHLGRLAYYRGDMSDALKLFGEEWQFHDRLDVTNSSRLYRSCANVLTDMGFLNEAEGLVRKACRAQDNDGEPERYKTYGRLAEILARKGKYDEAKTAYEHSWVLQRQITGNEDDLDAQTLVYMGHIHVLLNDFTEAESWYQQAEINENSGFNPYLCMGRAALFSRNKKRDNLAELWKKYGEAITQLHGVKALPKAVIAMARFNVGLIDKYALLEVFEELQKENYWVEACYFLPVLYPQPLEDEPAIQTIRNRLVDWNRDVKAFCQKTQLTNDLPTIGYPTLLNLLDDLTLATTNQNWQNAIYIKQVYPFKLLGGFNAEVQSPLIGSEEG